MLAIKIVGTILGIVIGLGVAAGRAQERARLRMPARFARGDELVEESIALLGEHLPNEVLASVSGQVIRTGIFQEKVFNEAFGFKLTLRLIRNPNMAMNGRFPTAVGDFKYEISK